MSKASALAQAIAAIAERVPERSSATRQMRAELNRLRLGADALVKVSTNRNPLDTPAAHAVKIAKLARQYDREVTASINRAAAALGEGIEGAKRRVGEKVNLTPDDKYAVAIASRFGSLKHADKMSLISELIGGNRGPELAAIIMAPSSLTGLSAKQQKEFETAILSTHAGEEMKEQTDLHEAMETVLAATHAAGDLAKSLTDPGELARIESGVAAADAAGNAFSEAIAQQ